MQTKLEIARAIRGANYDCQALWFFCGECPFDAFCSGAVAELSKVDISKHREAFVSQVNAFIKSEEGKI